MDRLRDRGGAELGDRRSTRGSTEECVAGDSCGYAGGEEKDSQICLEICMSDAVCQSGWFCEPVANSNLKACRPPDAM